MLKGEVTVIMGWVKSNLGKSRLGNYHTKYSQEAMERAIAVVRGDLCVKKTAVKYNVSRTTLGDRASGRLTATLGRPTQLTLEEEEILVQWVVLLVH